MAGGNPEYAENPEMLNNNNTTNTTTNNNNINNNNNEKTTSPPHNAPSKIATTPQGEIKNYKWTVLDKNFDVVFLVDPNKRNRKNGCLSVSVNGEKCLFKFIPDVPNNDGWTEFVYEEKTYILTRQPLPGKDYEINWCIHIPKR